MKRLKKFCKKMYRQFPSDVLGSYTGVPISDEKPIQDADDL